jgi:hypothetical protein
MTERWINVNYRKPEVDTNCIIAVQLEDGWHYRCETYRDYGFPVTVYPNQIITIYWQPLPQPPNV